jgi:branched-chain amino acid transport system substrate-binding protein
MLAGERIAEVFVERERQNCARACRLVASLPMRRNPVFLGVLLGAMVTSGCPRRFDPRAEEIRAGSSAAETSYREARALLQEGRAPEAEAALRRFTVEHPTDPLRPQATVLQARAALQQGEAARAVDLLLPLLSDRQGGGGRPAGSVPQAVQDRARFVLGLAQHRLGDFAGARANLQPFADQIVDSEDGTELHAILADLARREERVADALREYERFYNGSGTSALEQAYVREQVRRLSISLPPREAAEVRRRFGLDAQAPTQGQGMPSSGQAPAVGLVLPLGGKDRALGERVLRGALWGAGFFDGASGLRLHVRDAGPTPQSAAAAVSALAQEGVVAIIGSPGRGPQTEEILTQAARHGLPVLDTSPVSGVPGAARRGASYRLLHPGADRVRALIAHALNRGARTLAVLAPATAYGKAMSAQVATELAGKRARLVGQLSFPEGATTFAAQARELLALRPEALLLPVTVPQLELIAAQLATSSVIPTQDVVPKGGQAPPVGLLLATADGMGERLLRNAGRYLQGAVLAPLSAGAVPVADPGLPPPDEVARYQQHFGDEPGALDALGRDAARLVLAACENGGGLGTGPCTPARVARALPGLKLPGATGPLGFQQDGQREGPPLLLRVEGDSLRPVKQGPEGG